MIPQVIMNVVAFTMGLGMFGVLVILMLAWASDMFDRWFNS